MVFEEGEGGGGGEAAVCSGVTGVVLGGCN